MIGFYRIDRQVKKSKSRIIWMSLVLPDDGEITQFFIN
jgi:hypothetical protein